MQKDLDTAAVSRSIVILGVNEWGEESANDIMCQDRTLPWLQDLPHPDVWRSWRPTWRDVIVLDADNRVIRIYNLTEHNLIDSTNYAELREILVDASR